MVTVAHISDPHVGSPMFVPNLMNRVIVELIETGLEAREREKRTFFELADRLSRSTDPSEQKRLKEELARMTFGE